MANDDDDNEAPPTRHPSISGFDIISLTLSGLTDPPYWIITTNSCNNWLEMNTSVIDTKLMRIVIIIC